MASKTLLVLAIPPLGQALASARPAVRGRAVEIAIGSQHQRAHWRIPVGVMENVQGRQRGRGHQAIVGEQTQANNNGEKCDASHYNFISCLVAAPERPAIMEVRKRKRRACLLRRPRDA